MILSRDLQLQEGSPGAVERGFPFLHPGIAEPVSSLQHLSAGAWVGVALAGLLGAAFLSLHWRYRRGGPGPPVAGLPGRDRVTTAAALMLLAVVASASAYAVHLESAPRREPLERRPLGESRLAPPSPHATVRASESPPPARLSTSPAVTQGGAAAIRQQPRPFRHEEHEAVSCSACHVAGAEHRAADTRIWTPRMCAACHHDPTQPYTCAHCHGPGDLPAPGPVSQTLDLTVWEHPSVRELPFAHETHAGVACVECHATPVMLQVDRECASCHVEHHRPAAECTQCHVPEPEGHGIEVHLTCAGAGCHSPDSGLQPTHSRTLCLTCHTDQRDHEPDGDCATCHMIPDMPVEPTVAGTWLSRLLGGRR